MISGDGWVVHHGSCLDVLPTMEENSVDAIVTDPPYELGFMGKKWDSTGVAFDPVTWAECLRVLKPGGHLLAFGGSRTWHRIAVAIEDAGFEIRDSIAWLYGSGFPKSLDVSKAIDKASGAEREVLTETVVDIFGEHETRKEKPAFGIGQNGDAFGGHSEGAMFRELGEPVTSAAQHWKGWGTALKPAFEPVIVARKPFVGTVAQNVLEWGTGGLNINGTRIGRAEGDTSHAGNRTATFGTQETVSGGNGSGGWSQNDGGRWPANVMLDEFTAALLDEQSGERPSGGGNKNSGNRNGLFGQLGKGNGDGIGGDSGGASRFFYVAKASKRDRNEGLEQLEARRASAMGYDRGLGEAGEGMFKDRNPQKQNFHPTVKPTDLMRQLVLLVTPPGGTVLDPFTGSGSTGKAAILEGFEFIGVELTDDYLPIIEGRLSHAVTMRREQEAEQVRKENEALF